MTPRSTRNRPRPLPRPEPMMKTLVAAFWLTVMPGVAFAQAAVAGTVRDVSGAPMPGVAVEAASPALIEKVRSAVTDAAGRYRIERLRPGVYTVTFTRRDWRPFEQSGVELTGSFTATVDAVLSVGAVDETITVTKASPVVNRYSARHELTLSGKVLRSLPTARTYNALLVVVPGVLTSVNDTVTATASTSFPVYGGRTNEGRLLLDGLTVGSPPSGNSATSYAIDVGAAARSACSRREELGEAENRRARRECRAQERQQRESRVRASPAASSGRLQSDNLTPELRAAGGQPRPRRSRGSTTWRGRSAARSGRIASGTFVNGHVGGSTRDSAECLLQPECGRSGARGRTAPDLEPTRSTPTGHSRMPAAALTWQVTPPEQSQRSSGTRRRLCRTCTGATPGTAEPARISPEAVGVLGRPLHVSQATWSSPLHRPPARRGSGSAARTSASATSSGSPTPRAA